MTSEKAVAKKEMAHTSQRPKRPELIPYSPTCPPPPPVDDIIVHRRVSPKQYVTGTHLYTWMKRDKVSKVPLFKETTRRSRLEPRTSKSGVRGVNHSATHASKERLRRRVNRLGRFYWIHFNIEVFGN